MKLIGENINIMSKTIGQAMRDRDPKPIQELAIAEEKAGIDYLDINIGPARKAGDAFMEWMVKTVQEVTDLPLSLDTTNPVAMEAGLKVHKGKALINSISLVRMEWSGWRKSYLWLRIMTLILSDYYGVEKECPVMNPRGA